MMPVDYALLILALVGILDCQLERRTGRGLIARVQDFIKRRSE